MKKGAERSGKPEAAPQAAHTSTERKSEPRDSVSNFLLASSDYLRSVGQVWSEAQDQSRTACRDYEQAVQGIRDEVRQRAEETYRKYITSLQEIWGTEDAQARAEELLSNYIRDLRYLWTPNDELRCWEAQQNYARALKDIWSPERIQKSVSEAYRSYGEQLKEAWAGTDAGTLNPHALQTISQSMLSVARVAC